MINSRYSPDLAFLWPKLCNLFGAGFRDPKARPKGLFPSVSTCLILYNGSKYHNNDVYLFIRKTDEEWACFFQEKASWRECLMVLLSIRYQCSLGCELKFNVISLLNWWLWCRGDGDFRSCCCCWFVNVIHQGVKFLLTQCCCDTGSKEKTCWDQIE